MPTKDTIKKYTLHLFHVVLVVWVILLGFDWVSSYLESRSKSVEQETPFELSLKSRPEDVIFSQAKTSSTGKDEVLYAYLSGEASAIPNEDVARRTPNSQTVVLETQHDGEKITEKLQTTFYGTPQLYKDVEGNWRQIEYATTTPEVFSASGAVQYVKRREFWERLLPGKPVFSAVSTFYPNPSVESTSVDGYIDAPSFCGDGTDTQSAWSTYCVNAATGNSAIDNGTPDQVNSTQFNFYGDFFYISRSFLLFDTSALPDNATINSATFAVYVTATTNSDNDGDDTLNLVTTTPASNTALSTADYDQVGSVNQATPLDITSLSTNAYNTFTLNGTGLGNISKTSITKFGLREGHDFINSKIATGMSNYVGFSSADQTGTSQDPKLEVTYTVNNFSFGQWFPF
jgi:hypothetical protein